MTGVDVFGIAKLNTTSPYGVYADNKGWEYYSTEWHKELMIQRRISDSWFIGSDTFLHFRMSYGSNITVFGDGRVGLECVEKSSNMKLYLYDDRNLSAGISNALDNWRGRRWTPNNEFTIYFNKKANTPHMRLNSPFMEISLGSDHHFNTACPYNAHHYTLSILNSGKMCFTGEPYHTTSRGARPEGITDMDFWNTDFTGLPMDTDIGIKFIKRVSGNGRNVFLEAYKDMTNGANGGRWVKLFEFEHVDGNWDNESMENLYNISSLSNDCVIKPRTIDMPHAHDGGMCFVEITPIKELELKWLSCRDILPVFVPQSTSAELTESGSSGITESGL
jgi:hypothetical protein